MSGFSWDSGVRRAFLKLAPAALAARVLAAQTHTPPEFPPLPDGSKDARLPNGKLQRDEILKAQYEQNLKDARALVDISKAFELDLEKSDPFVLSLGLLRKLDDIEKLTKKIRGRMRH